MRRVSVRDLALDSENPRLFELGHDSSDERIIANLQVTADLAELTQSIASNGYLDIEPLIALEEGPPYRVLEGNRRLAAIRLLTDPELAQRIHDRTEVRIRVPRIPRPHRTTLDSVSVYFVPDRDAARSFIGFKHINGAHRWDAYAKAMFAARWHREGRVPLDEIAQSIGDRHDTIKRMVHAIYVLEQAEAAGVFCVEDRNTPRFSFSHLYTALARATYRQFLGVQGSWARYEPTTDPIAEGRLDELGEALRWMYGSKEDGVLPVVQSQNPDLKLLGEVLINSESLLILRETGSLREAAASLRPAGAEFETAIVRARKELRRVLENLRGFDVRNEVLLKIAQDNLEAAETIWERMRSKMRDRDARDGG